MRLDTIYFMISQCYFSLCSIRHICDFELDSRYMRYMDNYLLIPSRGFSSNILIEYGVTV